MKRFFVIFLAAAYLLLNPGKGYAQGLEIVADAQNSLPDPARYKSSIYSLLSVGPSVLGIETGYKNMHRLLKSQGLEPDKLRSMFQLGAGVRIHKVYVELYAASTVGSLTSFYYPSDNGRRVHTDFASVGINLGYALFEGRNESLILRAGADWAEYFLMFSSTPASGPLDLTRITSSPAGSIWPVISHAAPTANLSIEFLGGRAKKPATFAYDARLGYQFGIGQTSWEALEGSLLNAPTDKAGMLYLSIGVWIGRNFERKSKS